MMLSSLYFGIWKVGLEFVVSYQEALSLKTSLLSKIPASATQSLTNIELAAASTETFSGTDWFVFVIVVCCLLSFLWCVYKFTRWVFRRVGRMIARITGIFKPRKTKTKKPEVSAPLKKSVTKPASPSKLFSPNVSTKDTSIVKRKKAGSPWVPPGSSVTVAKRIIGGMVYVGTPPRDDVYGEPDNAFIDPALSVSKKGSDWEGSDLSYWPSYSRMTPLARATYLEWLSEGRSRVANPGYMFLYFYGLERRYFRDEPSEIEKQDIVSEVQRLRILFGPNRSAERYLTVFLEATTLAKIQDTPPEPVKQSELPLSLKVGLAQQIEAENPLSAQWLRAWFYADSETRLRTPAKRCVPEFVALFDSIFDRDYPNGLLLRRPKRKLKAIYYAASGRFEADLTNLIGDLADVSSLRKPLTVADKIADEATEALEKYSRLLGKDSHARGSIAAHALLPLEIRNQFPSSEAGAIADWAGSIIDEGGLVDAIELLHKLTGTQPDKLTRKRLTDASDTMLGLGIGMAPDPRFALRSPKYGEPVILFKLPPNTHVLDVSELFGFTALRIGIATMIAQVDGVVDSKEEAMIESIVIDTPNISTAERLRLSATARWMRAVPPDIGSMRKRMKAAPEATRAVFAKLAVDMAAADGNASKEEVGQLEKLYKALGLDTASLYGSLHSAVADASDEPVSVRKATPSLGGLNIPVDIALTETFDTGLDLAKVARISEDTRNVSVLLGGIFNEEEADSNVQDEYISKDSSSFPGLTPAQTDFARELSNHEHWSEVDFDVAAKKHGLMSAGALEAINEWSFTAYDRVFLDEYDGYDVDPDIAAEVREKIV